MIKIVRKIKVVLVLGLALVGVAGCSAENKNVAEEDLSTEGSMCSILSSSNWQAFIEEVVGGSYTLSITGDVETPTPGYVVSFTMGKTDRAAIPAQNIEVNTKPPEGMVAQVLTTSAVEFKTKTPFKKYRRVSLYCGGDLLVAMDDVE